MNLVQALNSMSSKKKQEKHTKSKNKVVFQPAPEQGKKQQEAQKKYSPQQINNFFSHIIDDTLTKQKNLNPQFLRIKNNILLIILILSTYAIYNLYSDFLDTMLLAFIGGIGYQQMRERYVKFWLNDQPLFEKQMTMSKRISLILFYLLVIFILPWFRNILSHPEDFKNHMDIADILYAHSLHNNVVVILFQAFLLLRVFHLILAPKVLPKIAQYIPRNMEFHKVVFAFAFIILSLIVVTVVPSLLYMQISKGGQWIQTKVQKHIGCQIISYATHNNSDLPFCSEKLMGNNTFIQEALKQVKTQSSEIQDCMTQISKFQKNYFQKYIGTSDFFNYEQVICTWFSFGKRALTYMSPQTDVFTTGASVFKMVLGNMALVLSEMSNVIFSITTFIMIFYVTVTYFDTRSNVLQQIFYGQRKELISQITNLIQATILIVVQHFLMSIFLLQLFSFSSLNMMIATFLSSMAFVPFFKPWYGALLFSIIRGGFSGQYLINLVFVALYYYLSGAIYTSRYKNIQFHEIITNMSVLFGIYQFGVAGIFYGPMIMILFRSVHRQLLRNKIYTQSKEKNHHNREHNHSESELME